MVDSISDTVLLSTLLVLGFTAVENVCLKEEVNEQNQIGNIHECGKDEDARVEVALDLEKKISVRKLCTV